MQHALAGTSPWLGLACALYCITAAAQPAAIVEAGPGSEADATREPNQATRIVLVASPGMDELAARFAAELGSLRFDVVRAPDAEGATSAELQELARRHAARAAVRVSRAGSAVDLWLVNPETHEVLYRRVVADGDPAVAVLRSLEILRGALVDLQALKSEPGVEEPAERAPSELPRRGTEPAKTAPPWFGLSGALMAARAGRKLAGGATAGLSRNVGSRFAVHGELLAPLGEWSLDGEGGSAKVRAGAVSIGALVLPWGERAFTPGLGLGVGLLALYARGEARAGYLGTSALNLSAFPHSRLNLTVRLTGSIRLRAAFVAGFATPRPVLLFADQRQESWLNPLFLSSLGAEVALH